MNPNEAHSGGSSPADDASRQPGWLAARVVPVALVAVVIAVSGAWTADSVRLWAVENLGPSYLVDLEAALGDPEPAVAIGACRHLLPRDSGELSREAKATLRARPAVASGCFEALVAAEANAAPDDIVSGSRWRMIAEELANEWLERALTQGIEDCAPIESARRAMQASDVAASYPIMHCAMWAQDDGTRECCTAQLGGEARFQELLEEPNFAPLDRVRDDFEALVTLWFGDSTPAGVGKERKRQIQDWLVGVGCRMHLEEPGERIIVSAFRGVIETPACAEGGTTPASYYSAQNWEYVCTDLYTSRRAEAAASPREAICDSLGLAALSAVVDDAEDEVQKAVSAAAPKARFGDEQLEISDIKSGRGITNRWNTRHSDLGPAAAEATRDVYEAMARELH